ncbi:hypothetical protein ACVRWQ_06020 [Streptococcus phocae subsp. salmonis]|uniref:hypothetical protein n=1 Tax=Streptococcus phocae TaxID=119224 RepID=UPI000530C336|nr:hypothetical protein [Streptococcus phocae]KGR72893.1 hypothetical protein NX86_03975 [Streptococcus phocae subsp. salmonis]QBX27845.1 hypothetical protein Javan420_0045 [Streptococcus phage Javan420]
MNKRIKKKRKLETAIVMLIGENAMQAEAIKNQNDRITRLESTVTNSSARLSAITLDNQVAIKSIGDDVDYIKKNYKKKWGK